jgi:cobalt-precorrin 5A hydrolase
LVVTTQTWGAGYREAGLVWLLPRWVVAGVGCKRGTSAAAIIDAVTAALAVGGIHPAALRGLASVVAKADEPGLQEAAEELGVSLAIALDDDVQLQIAAHSLAESAWVRDHIGVGAACEPAALWAAGPGARLVLPKQAANGITVALAMVEGGDMTTHRRLL